MLKINIDKIYEDNQNVKELDIDTVTKSNLHHRQQSLEYNTLEFNYCKDVIFIGDYNIIKEDNVTEVNQDFSIKNNDEVLVVDLQGFIDWKQKLFGVISLNEGEIKWQQSEFYEKVVKGHRSFKIINLSKSAKKEFEQELV